MTLDECISEAITIWTRLSLTGGEYIEDIVSPEEPTLAYLLEEDFEESLMAPCRYAIDMLSQKSPELVGVIHAKCNYCPIWTKEKPCFYKGGPYDSWEDANAILNRKEWAKYYASLVLQEILDKAKTINEGN